MERVRGLHRHGGKGGGQVKIDDVDSAESCQFWVLTGRFSCSFYNS